MEKSIKKIILIPFQALITFYRLLISPWMASSCRFQPTCSEYAQQALKEHGVLKGSYMTLTRLIKCHPWGGSGYNPVPPAINTHINTEAACHCNGDKQAKQRKPKSNTVVN